MKIQKTNVPILTFIFFIKIYFHDISHVNYTCFEFFFLFSTSNMNTIILSQVIFDSKPSISIINFFFTLNILTSATRYRKILVSSQNWSRKDDKTVKSPYYLTTYNIYLCRREKKKVNRNRI